MTQIQIRSLLLEVSRNIQCSPKVGYLRELANDDQVLKVLSEMISKRTP